MKFSRLSTKGIALPTVIMVLLVTMTLGCIALSLVTSQAKTEVIYEDNFIALHSAEAGLNKYLWSLNKTSPTTIVLGTPIKYPDDNPTAEYILSEEPGTTEMKKVIKSTGWALSDPTVKRTIIVTFTKRSFTEFVYFSDNDPSTIVWYSRDICYGPYHTNTSLYVQGSPTFYGKVSYVLRLEDEGQTPNYKKGTERVGKRDFPTDNSELYNYADADGIIYNGRTSIFLKPNGKMDVWNLNQTPNLKLNVDIPNDNVIYVTGTTDTDSSNKFNRDKGNVFISGILSGRLTVACANDIFITDYNPTLNTFSNVTETNGITYANTTFSNPDANGDSFIQPVNATHMLGLVANKNVCILTRGWFNDSVGNSAYSAKGDITVCAAIFAIHGKFGNSYQIASEPDTSFPDPGGILSVYGSIIQEERGAVGKTSGIGYSKRYIHDSRMLYDQPPYFLLPENTGWEINEWYEVN